MNKKTIFAISTPGGKSALAVIRVSGPNAIDNIKKISSKAFKIPNKAFVNHILDKDKTTIDQTITTYFKSPKSFTGEDMVEISTHGGGAVTRKIIKRLASLKGFKEAEPGEFSRRAFENNKLDLTQVEAIADIVNAETEIQRKQAIKNLSGGFFKSSKKTFEKLKKIQANIDAIIDFSEEDLPKNLLKNIKEQIENTILGISNTLKNSSFGISVRSGFLVAILGKPNTGKSSFINLVSDKEVAIVTNIPGTTRDLIESYVDLGGYPIRFVDTAGIRKSKNKIENIGVQKALKASKESNINLVFIKNKRDISQFKKIKKTIFVRSKQDIHNGPFKDNGFYNISSKSKYGVPKLLSIIQKKVSSLAAPENAYISRERHIICLEEAKNHLINAKKDKTTDMLSEDIRMAIKSFKKLFGDVDIEDILDIIFSDFCIGK
tara:strand:+ start:392 stop:1693 length:1302 start_codon:yes stop_codon:yes gene_type:complete